MKIIVAILNYNGKQWLEKFLPTVVSKSKEAEIVVIDNASTDDSITFLKQFFPKIQLVINKENHGFAGGYNEGLKSLEADYFILLNSDVEVTDNWIMPVIDALEQDQDIAAAQPKVLAYNNKSHFEHAGAAGGMMDQYGYPFCRGRIFNYTEQDQGQFDAPTEIFWATGACLFIRANVFKEQGGFDANYFAHMEEIDLCWRIKNSGKKILYLPNSTVYHVGGGTLDYMSPFKTYLNFRNSLYTLHKNYDGFLPLVIFIRLVLDGIAGIKFLFGGEFKNIWSIIKSHFHYYKHIPQLNKQRRALPQKKYSQLVGVYNKSIVWQFFALKKQNYSDL
ncbi:MAG: glycosyltransferase family 2 protein [Flavobacteriales bacterium]|nr:glycosyltransferase family 2 protein [Flavobacteriales bacterium]